MRGLRKWSLGVLGLLAVVLLAMAGRGDPAAFGAIGLIVSVIGGGQSAVDWLERRAGNPMQSPADAPHATGQESSVTVGGY